MDWLVPVAFAALSACVGLLAWLWPTLRSHLAGRRTERALARFARERGWSFERAATVGEPPYLSTVRSIFGLCGELHALARDEAGEIALFAYRFGSRPARWRFRLEAVGFCVRLALPAPTLLARAGAHPGRSRGLQEAGDGAQTLWLEPLGGGIELWSPPEQRRAARRWFERHLAPLFGADARWNVRCRDRWCVGFLPQAVGNRAPTAAELEQLAAAAARLARSAAEGAGRPR